MKQSLRRLAPVIGLIALTLLAACRHDEIVIPIEYDTLPIAPDPAAERIGIYLLNEGNMGSNKATIDYIDLRSAAYFRNMYAERNPEIIKELGDVGNDIQIYGSRLYAVINCSHKVEVMDAYTLKRIGQVDIPNCRYIRFSDGNAYVSAYVGPVAIDPDAQLGAVYRVDTATLQITAKCTVGYQPEELVITDDRIYVANSGGYTRGHYETTVSVIDINAFKEVERIEIAPNLHRVRSDNRGVLWITSRGDHTGKVAPSLTAYDTRKRRVVARFDDYPVGDMWMDGDRLYTVGEAWNEEEQEWSGMAFSIIDTSTMTLINDCFITDGSDALFQHPYGVAVNPVTKDILVTDAMSYITPGWLRCYGQDGVMKWQVRTGDIPAHFLFVGKEKQANENND